VFDKVPKEGIQATASGAEGKVFIDYDVFSPVPDTEKLTLKVTGGEYFASPEAGEGDYERIHAHVEITGSTLKSCEIGTKGELLLQNQRKHNYVFFSLDACADEGQRATIGKRSPIHIDFFRHCRGPNAAMRVTQARGDPLCASAPGRGAGNTYLVRPGTSAAQKVTPSTVFDGRTHITISGYLTVRYRDGSTCNFDPFYAFGCQGGAFDHPINALWAGPAGGAAGESNILINSLPGRQRPALRADHTYNVVLTLKGKAFFWAWPFGAPDPDPRVTGRAFRLMIGG
jgi:hypothetical protein